MQKQVDQSLPEMAQDTSGPNSDTEMVQSPNLDVLRLLEISQDPSIAKSSIDEDEVAEWWSSSKKWEVNGQEVKGKELLKLGVNANTVTIAGFSSGGYKTAYIFN